jgi:predicted DNA-binding ribbon-helix-helix protein
VKSTSQKSKEAAARRQVMLSVRLDPAMHQELRRIAYERRVSIHSLLIEGVDTVRKKYLKPER